MFLSRVLCSDGQVSLVLRQGSEAARVRGDADIAALACRAVAEGAMLVDLLLDRGLGAPIDVADLLVQGRVLCAVPDGPSVLLPAGVSDATRPLTLVAPGKALGLGQGGTLEGGVAALFVTGDAGRACLIGWTLTHTGMGADAHAQRMLCCGPEICLRPDPAAGTGQVRLIRNADPLLDFAMPQARPLPDTKAGFHGHAEGTFIILRLSRWLLRPRAHERDTDVESHGAGLGLALRNGLAYESNGLSAVHGPLGRQA